MDAYKGEPIDLNKNKLWLLVVEVKDLDSGTTSDLLRVFYCILAYIFING